VVHNSLARPERRKCGLTGRSSRPAPAAVVSPGRGPWGIIAARAYAVCLRGSAQLNVRRREHHQPRKFAAVQQVLLPRLRFGTAAEPRRTRAGKVRRTASIELAGPRRAASPRALRGRRQRTRVNVSVAGACALRYRLAEPLSNPLRGVQAPGRCRTGRVRPVRVAVARFGQQNQGMSLFLVYRMACAAPAVGAGNRATCSRRK
jgi:hypothetical protein